MSACVAAGNCGQINVSASKIVIPDPRHILRNRMVFITPAFVTFSAGALVNLLFLIFGFCLVTANPGIGNIKYVAKAKLSAAKVIMFDQTALSLIAV